MSRQKYSDNFKIKLMKLYFYDNKSYDYLHNKYHINLRLLEEWHNLVQIWGFKSLKDHNNYHHFDSAFKLEVVKYYLNHHEGLLKVAARFEVSYSNIFYWTKAFQRQGYLGLKPNCKGRCPIRRISNNKNKGHEIAKLKAENRSLKLDNIILKTLARVERQTARKHER